MRSIQWRIAIPFISLIVITMSVLGLYLNNFVRNTRINDLRSQLNNDAHLVVEASLPYLPSPDALDALAKRLGKQIDARVTIIAADGTVLGDSDEDPANMDNHLTRPEVSEALSSGVGESTRFSSTLGEQMMYVAVVIPNQDKTIGVARVALPLTAITLAVNHITLTVALAIVAMILLAGLAAWLIARVTTRSVREVTRASRRLARGELGQSIPVRARDESGELARAFNEMSSSIRELVENISSERAKLATVLTNMTDGVIMTDEMGNIVLANQAAGKMFHLQAETVMNQPVIEVVHDHEVDEVLKLCLRTGRQQSQEFEGVSGHYLQAIAIPIIREKINGILLLFQDLTEMRSLQTTRRELIGNISHDLRTPISGIKLMLETLHDGAIDDRKVALDFLARIESEVDRLTQMVAELTELSRIETGRVELNKEPVNLNELIRDVIDEMAPLAERQQVTVKTSLSPDLPVTTVDKDRIRQTIINIIHNAIKFNHPGGECTVSTSFNQQSVTVSVKDTGIGISRADLPHVFERFFKTDRARTAGGSGLGLAIAKHTVQAHGGTIRAESEEGKGSTFSFSLPTNLPGQSNTSKFNQTLTLP